MSLAIPNTSTVWRFRSSLMEVTPSDFSMENLRDREVGRIRAHQRDIGSVQRRNERQTAFRRDHLLRQHRGDRMRNRVMDVQQIQIVGVGHVHHARRQRQAIGRILKQRVIGNFDFVIMNPRRARIQTNGVRVGDEMNLVPAVGEFEAQFRRDDAAAAVGRITSDSDVHVRPGKEDVIRGLVTLGFDPGESIVEFDDFAQQQIEAVSNLWSRDEIRLSMLASRPSMLLNRDSRRPIRPFKSVSRPLFRRIPISTVIIVGTLASARTKIWFRSINLSISSVGGALCCLKV